jgi:hypothetical protein
MMQRLLDSFERTWSLTHTHTHTHTHMHACKLMDFYMMDSHICTSAQKKMDFYIMDSEKPCVMYTIDNLGISYTIDIIEAINIHHLLKFPYSSFVIIIFLLLRVWSLNGGRENHQVV